MSETNEELDAYGQPEFDALGYLQAVYQGKIIAEGPRMKAAIEALPFEKPKLSASANVYSFASQMEEMSRIRGQSNVIDAKANHGPSEDYLKRQRALYQREPEP